jgi:hypothetical protein
MRRFNLFLTLAATLMAFLFTSSVFAQDSTMVQKRNHYKQGMRQGNGSMMQGQKGAHGFIDENGDGFNDNAPDADGDGIPNGMDEDYQGTKMHKGHGSKGFVDADGDGINDNAMDDDGDGIPNGQDEDFVRPEDGSGRMNNMGQGHGKGMKGSGNGSGMGTGDCDGTGPKGGKGKGGH